MAKKDILCLTKKQQVQAEIARIHFEHRYDAGAMFGTLTDREAKVTYEKLALRIPQIPGLTDQEKEELLQEVQERIQNIPQVEQDKRDNPDEYPEEREDGVSKKTLFKNKVEQVRDRIEQVHYEHRYDAGAMWGVLTAREAESEYVKLMGLLYSIPDITPEERDMLVDEIQQKIDKIPEVEEEKHAEYLAFQEKQGESQKPKAKKGFSFKSIFRRKKK